MLAIYIIASPDRGLSWLIVALLAFLVISAVVGAMVGAGVLDGRAPGALRETEGASTEHEQQPRS